MGKVKEKINFKDINWKKMFQEIIVVLIGSILLAFAASFFFINYKNSYIYKVEQIEGQLNEYNISSINFNGILVGGTSGFSLIIRNIFTLYFNINADSQVEMIITITTWVLFLLGLIFVGKKFALHTLISTIAYPVFIYLFKLSIFNGLHTQINQFDPVVCAIAGGCIMGTGCGISYRVGGSTGGFDILGIVLNKYLKIKLSIIFFILDGLLVVLAFVAKFSLYEIIIGLLAVLSYSVMVELTQRVGTEAYYCDIISEKWEDINQDILTVLERGTTILDAAGGYTGTKRKLIKTLIGKNQYLSMIEIVKKHDPNAFMSLTLTRSVFGEGYRNIKEFSNQ